MIVERTCQVCGGSGKNPDDLRGVLTCWRCDGNGRIQAQTTIDTARGKRWQSAIRTASDEREKRLENLVIEALDYLNSSYVEQKHLIIRILRELDLDNNEIRGYFTGDIIVPLNPDDEEHAR